MAIKRGSKVEVNGSSASMTDLMFLLLIFLLIATTLIAPNALKLVLPQSNTQSKEDKAITTVSITADLQYFIETEAVPFNELPGKLHQKLKDEEEPTISLHCDQTVPINEVVKVMNIARDLKYKLILATAPE